MNTSTIKPMPFSLHTEAALLPSLIDCYQEVYGGPEWNEWWKCAVRAEEEGHHWGRHQEAEVRALGMMCCGKPIEIYWPSEKVEGTISKEVTDESSCWVCVDGDKVVGALWGYPVSLDDLEAVKFEGFPVAARIREIFGPVDRVAYQSEAILRKPYRGNGLYQEMVRRREANFRAKGLTVAVVRTRRTPEPSKSYHYSKKYGYTIVAEYPESDGRVIQARSMIDLS